MNDPLRFAVVGCGVIGATHADAIVSLNDAELAAVVDDIPERAAALGERYGVAAYSDLDELLRSETVDAVAVCTPSGAHLEPAVTAMRAGKAVLVEKPIEITLDRIDHMLEVSREMGVVLGGVFQHRFDPASREVHRLARDGEFGTLVLGTAQLLWWRSQHYYDSGAWRGTWALDGGGVLMNQTIHTIDLLLWAMGPVASVRAYTGTLAHSMETEDTAVASLRFRSGALGTVTATTAAYPGVATRLDVLGTRGSATIENDHLVHLHLARDETEPVGDYGLAPASPADRSASDLAPGETNSHAVQIADFVDAVRNDRPPLVNGSGARAAVELILGIYESAGTGQEVVFS
jgi:UDP-N-acetyl-2-amino-2-deoxyglucuronate dehydrogenase